MLSKERASSDFEEINTRLNSIDLSILRITSEKKGKRLLALPNESKNFDSNQIKLEQELLKNRLDSLNLKENQKGHQLEKQKKIFQIYKND